MKIRLSIRYKFILGALLIVMMAIIAFAYLTMERESKLLFDNQVEYAVSVNRLLASQLFSEVLRSSKIPVDERIAAITSQLKYLTHVDIYAVNKKNILSYTSLPKTETYSDSLINSYLSVETWFSDSLKVVNLLHEKRIIIISPIVTNGVPLNESNTYAYNGVCAITYSTEGIYNSLTTTRKQIIITSLILILVSILLTIIAVKFLSSAIQKVIDGVKRFDRGEKNIQIHVRSADEIGDLSRFINEMMVNTEIHINTLNTQKQVLENLTRQAKESEEKFRSLLESARDLIVHFTSTYQITYANEKFGKVFTELENPVTRNLLDFIVPEYVQSFKFYLENLDREEFIDTLLSLQMLDSDRRIIQIEMTCSVLKMDKNRIFQAMLRDVTDQAVLKEELIQAKKMESIGRLAGGIAHDFNNLLAIIIPNAELVQFESQNPKIEHYIDQILSAAHRASEVVKHLLNFSRQKPSVMKPTGLHELIEQTVVMLEQLIPEKIVIQKSLKAEYDIVALDETQIQQILINLAVNARDAMPDGGTLTLATKNIRVAKEFSIKEYIQLNISDTGIGMEEDVRAEIFDPFFTTKKVGEGIGMGLAGAFAVIQMHNGTITVQSEKNKGTNFTITLPLHKPFMI